MESRGNGSFGKISGSALVLRGKEAKAILDGHQRYVPMTFNCRSVEKGDTIFLLVKCNDDLFPGCRCQGGCGEARFKAVGEVDFISNRRFDEDKLLREGACDKNMLPGNHDELRELRSFLGLPADKTDKVKARDGKEKPHHYILWEVAVQVVVDPPFCLSKVTALVASSSATMSDQKPLSFKDRWVGGEF